MSLYLPISVAVPLVGVGEAGVEIGQPLLYQGVSLSTYLCGCGCTSGRGWRGWCYSRTAPSCIRVSLYLPISVAVPLVGVGEAGVEVGQPLLYQGVSLSTYLCGCTLGRGWRGWC